MVFPVVSLVRRDELDPAVAMLTVVPISKVESPLARRFDRRKGLAWVPRAVLEGAKQAL